MALLMIGAQFALAAENMGGWSPFPPVPFDSSTSRDAFGYNWVDNNGGGGPTYHWVDITTRGTRVLGLTDDNFAGPDSIGFSFPYYWYTVNHVWIGSNGYVEFGRSYNFAHPFSDIPVSSPPNDFLSPLTGDLDFSRGSAECYYWTNHADSFVVSWINVGEFGFIDSTHTFQLILNAADSSITFQYGQNHGRFLDSSGGTRTVIGIENITGTVGLQYLRDNLPANHMWHDGLAIRFHPIPNPGYSLRDAGVVDAMNDGSQAIFIPTGTSITPHALYKNYGTLPDSNIIVTCIIRRGSAILYNFRDTIPSLPSLAETWIDFPSDFTVDNTPSTFRATWTASMTGDQYPGDNSLTTEMLSYQLPQELAYDDGLVDEGRSWTGDSSGFGVEFQIPQPCSISTGRFNVYSVTTPGVAWAWIYPDDGSGRPDLTRLLAADTVQVTTTGWANVDFRSANLSFAANERFYFVALHALENTFAFGMDDTPPLSNRGWEYTGGMAPDRNRSVSNIMFRLTVREAPTGIEEGITPKAFSLSQNYPNPFNAQTNILFSLEKSSDVSISIYGITGQLVEKISGFYPAGDNVVTWNASDKASGIYFYRLAVGKDVETRKMILLK